MSTDKKKEFALSSDAQRKIKAVIKDVVGREMRRKVWDLSENVSPERQPVRDNPGAASKVKPRQDVNSKDPAERAIAMLENAGIEAPFGHGAQDCVPTSKDHHPANRAVGMLIEAGLDPWT